MTDKSTSACSVKQENLYLSLGSNLGDREEMLHRAIALIEERIGTVQRVSSFIETEPWGFHSENPFLNAACLVCTALAPEQCLERTQQIERELGRKTKSQDGIYHDRIIDIDILLYGENVIEEPRLTIPHPLMHKRTFVLEPLAEIAPEAIHPTTGKKIRQLLEELNEPIS